MPKYSVDVWGTGPKPENYQFEADSPEEAEQEAREFTSVRMITNIEVEEMRGF